MDGGRAPNGIGHLMILAMPRVETRGVTKLKQELPVRKQIRPRPSGFELN